jgi:ABC-type multidrug transport system fused ATPase/permease subunit
LCQNFTELELKMNAMERIKHYTNIKTEKPYDKDHARLQAKEEGGAQLQLLEPPPSWPDKGRVEFNNICARYRPELDRVLDGVSFVVESRQKVGVVGRTGSGKSSLMLTLFRVLELERGSITIDGVDVARCGLKQLRQSIAMLPQDPTIFSGSIKQNLVSAVLYADYGWKHTCVGPSFRCTAIFLAFLLRLLSPLDACL